MRDHVITVSSSLFPRPSSDSFIKGTPAFVSIATSYTATNHTYGLKDDLESILYIVLYCTLQWLPVTSSRPLNWWLTQFFSVEPGEVGGAPLKAMNATGRYYTEGLKTTRSRAILDWLNATMDLHYHANGGKNPSGPNPAWNDGRALQDMWKKTLEGALPEDDRCENPVPDMIRQQDHPHNATYTAGTTSTILFASRGAPLPPPSTIDTVSMGPSKPWSVTLPPPSPSTTKRAASDSFSTDGGTESFDNNPNRRRRSNREGADAKRRRTNSHMMPPPSVIPSPSRRFPPPPPGNRRASRSSTRRSAGRP